MLTAAALAHSALMAQPVLLNHQHGDIGVAYEGGLLIPHIHDESADVEYGPGEATLQVGQGAAAFVPADKRFSFLGTPGDRIFVLPQVQHPDLLFLGLAAEEIEKGLFLNDSIRLELKDVQGPGHFALYRTSGIFGDPVVSFNSRDGLDSSDGASLAAGAHADFNWAFSKPGDYTLTIEASGVLSATGSAVSSGRVGFNFQVIPEPVTSKLFGFGTAIAAVLKAWDRKNRVEKERVAAK